MTKVLLKLPVPEATSEPNAVVPIDQARLTGVAPVSVQIPSAALSKIAGLERVNESVSSHPPLREFAAPVVPLMGPLS
jgi:hypothetical protein